MLKIFSLSTITTIFLALTNAHAAPLGYIPTIQDQNLALIFDFRSDLWTSPYTYKDSPVRIMGANARIPLLNTETWAASASLYTEALNLGRADFQLGKENIFIGNSLRNEHVGVGVRKLFGRGSSLSAFGAIATASDDPWGSKRDDYYYASVIYRTEVIENHQWLFAVDYSGNRGLYNGHPFPYFGVTFPSSSGIQWSLGFPFVRAGWTIADEWHTSFQLTPFGTRLETKSDIESGLTVGASAAFSLRSYLFDKRVDEEDRLFYQEIAAEVYLSKTVTSATRVTFAIGGAMDRKIYETERLYVPNAETETIANDFYGRLGVEFSL